MRLPLGFPNALRSVIVSTMLLQCGCSELPYFIGLEPTGMRYDGSYIPFAAERA